MAKIKKNKARKQLGIKEWMAYKPYDQPTDYDRDYLDYTRDLIEETLVPLAKSKFINVFQSPEDFERTAIIIASYVEDLKSGIGLWNAFVKKNKELYGVPVPFVETVKYVEGDVNLADIRYLIWWYFYGVKGVPVDPNSDLILGLASSMLVFIQEEWDTLPETDFYQDYWKQTASDRFAEVYRRLDWLGMKSYLAGQESYKYVEANLRGMMKDRPDLHENKVAQFRLSLDFVQDYLFRSPTSFAGLSPLEWMKAIMQAKGESIEELAESNQLIGGFFECTGETDTHFKVKYLGVDEAEELEITKAAFLEEGLKMGQKWILKLVRSADEWWVLMPSVELTPDEIANAERVSWNNQQLPYYMIPKAERQERREAIRVIEAHFEEYFGGKIKTFDSTEAAQSAYDAFSESTFVYKGEEVTYHQMVVKAMFGTQSHTIAGPVIFFIPGEGISSLDGLATVEEKLTQLKYEDIEERKRIFATLFLQPFPVVLLRDLMERYPDAPWYLAVPRAETRMDQWADAFLRFFHPGAFAAH
ncbi:MAG: DUF3843 family protein [Bacteroidota bacterium]